jgi:hypothetical protein
MKKIFAAVVTLGSLVFLTGIILAYLFGVNLPRPEQVEYPAPDNQFRSEEINNKKDVPFKRPDPGWQSPRGAIVMDDLGWVKSTASILENIDAPLTMGLMPGRPHSREFYSRWKDQFEFILHMPMEPLGYPVDDPGEYALFTEMSSQEIKKNLLKFLNRYPRIVGINNHMGSAFTADKSGMDAVMDVLADRGLYYLDSNTNPNSVAGEMAAAHGVSFLKNQVFLDRKTDPRYIDNQLKKLIKLARRRGEAIGIGHIQSENTARVLAHRIPQYQKQGIEFVSLSEIVVLPPLRLQKSKK